jgi:hypothetical protein
MSELSEHPKKHGFSHLFRVVCVLYGVAVPVACVGAFGAFGLLLGLLIVGAWAYVISSRSRLWALVKASIVCVVCFIVFKSLLPGRTDPIESARRSVCKNNLRQIGVALNSYHERFGTFPPARTVDENGQSMHSWRVLILPFLGAEGLYEDYDFSEPWNGPQNRRLLDRIPEVYVCPSQEAQVESSHATSYVAVVGRETVIGDSEGRARYETAARIASVGMVVEFNTDEVAWTEPRDLNLDSAVAVLSSDDPDRFDGHAGESMFYWAEYGRFILTTDGSTYFVSRVPCSEFWSEILTVGVGNDWSGFEWKPTSRRRYKTEFCYWFGAFIFLTALPLPWVWWKRRDTV